MRLKRVLFEFALEFGPLNATLIAALPGDGLSRDRPAPAPVNSGPWPASTAVESNSAWPGRVQPHGLQGWPMVADSSPGPCWQVSVIHDMQMGWPGQCLDLSQDRNIISQETCATSCRNSPTCSVWQFETNTACWKGSG